MSKELDRIKKSHFTAMACLNTKDKETEQAIEIVEKREKALKAIKGLLYFDFNDSGKCISIMSHPNQECDYTILFCETQEEYELLKEVLNNGR